MRAHPSIPPARSQSTSEPPESTTVGLESVDTTDPSASTGLLTTRRTALAAALATVGLVGTAPAWASAVVDVLPGAALPGAALTAVPGAKNVAEQVPQDSWNPTRIPPRGDRRLGRSAERRATAPRASTTSTASPTTSTNSDITTTNPTIANSATNPTTTNRMTGSGTPAPRADVTASSRTPSAVHSSGESESRLKWPQTSAERGYAAAALAARPVAVGPVSVADPARTLLRKATFGHRRSDVARLEELGIERWIEEQLDPALTDPDGDRAWALFPLAGLPIATVRAKVEMYHWDAMYDTVYGSLARQVYSRRQLFEMVVDVFTNRLHVPMPAGVWSTGPSFYNDVIRRHAFGSYEKMLLAAMRHPAMLRYLSNNESDREHVNENLGRELLELHTVGRLAGYTEDHVKASARILSGRSVDWRTDQFLWDSNRHATGAVRVLGFSHANTSASGGLEMGDDYLRYLARHPDTARSVSRSIALRFVSDTPPPALIEAMAQAYLAEGTSIRAALRAMFASVEFWESAAQKVRRPHDDAVATARILEPGFGPETRTGVSGLYWSLNEAGQPPLGWAAPNGYPDVAAAWLSAGGMLARWNMHRKVAFGWFKGLGLLTPEALVSDIKAMTVEQYFDQICPLLIGQPMSARDRDALIAATGFAATQKIGWRSWQVANTLVPLILDSVYFQVR